jgi:hypothetical protein
MLSFWGEDFIESLFFGTYVKRFTFPLKTQNPAEAGTYADIRSWGKCPHSQKIV